MRGPGKSVFQAGRVVSRLSGARVSTLHEMQIHSAAWRAKEASVIKKVAGGYKVVSENGKKNLGGPYKTKAEAEKRLKQVEYFKHRG